ncbi:MAG: DUF5689 domain-containing protein [Microscillaceae bacterium]|nr:DUF5689 domain-containing protein [Microscillaceae bacterium]
MNKRLSVLTLIKFNFLGILALGFFLNGCIEEEISIPVDALNPIPATIPEILTGKYEGLLVRIQEVQFSQAEGNIFSGTKELTDCQGNMIQVFTASNKVFSNQALPTGNGPIIAKVAREGTSVRLVLRSLDDVAGMVGLGCGQFANCIEKIGLYTNVCYLRNQFEEGITNIPSNDVRIRVTVTSDNQGGNLEPQSILAEDVSAGIWLRFDNTHNFRPGDVLDIDLSGLVLSKPEGWLGIQNIPLSKATKLGTNTLNPISISINQLNAGIFESRLVKIENIQFSEANGSTVFGTNQTRNFSNGANTAGIKINPGASFADRIIPSGSITLIGNVGVFSDINLLLPRKASDVGLANEPTEAQTCINGNILDVRSLYTGTTLHLNCSEGIRITGIVTSRADELNIPNQNIFLQDASAGISVRFTAPHTFKPGDEININLAGSILTDFNGLLQIEQIPLDQVSLNSSSNAISPTTITVAELNSGNFEGQLVRIQGLSFAQAGQALYNGIGSGTARTFSDATGSAVLFTYDDPLWAGTTLLPAGSGNALIGNASVFEGQIRILIRDPADIL